MPRAMSASPTLCIERERKVAAAMSPAKIPYSGEITMAAMMAVYVTTVKAESTRIG